MKYRKNRSPFNRLTFHALYPPYRAKPGQVSARSTPSDKLCAASLLFSRRIIYQSFPRVGISRFTAKKTKFNRYEILHPPSSLPDRKLFFRSPLLLDFTRPYLSFIQLHFLHFRNSWIIYRKSGESKSISRIRSSNFRLRSFDKLDGGGTRLWRRLVIYCQYPWPLRFDFDEGGLHGIKEDHWRSSKRGRGGCLC